MILTGTNDSQQSQASMMTHHITIHCGHSASSLSVSEWVRIQKQLLFQKENAHLALGPIIGRWNQFLEKQFPLRSLTNIAPLAAGVKIGSGAGAVHSAPIGVGQVSGMAVAKRVAADQLFMAPLGLALFIGSMGAMEGQDSAHVARKYRDLYPDALRANWQVWPLAQVVNFRYMPLSARVPFQSTCGIFWNLYLSLLNSREGLKERNEEAMRKTVG